MRNAAIDVHSKAEAPKSEKPGETKNEACDDEAADDQEGEEEGLMEEDAMVEDWGVDIKNALLHFCERNMCFPMICFLFFYVERTSIDDGGSTEKPQSTASMFGKSPCCSLPPHMMTASHLLNMIKRSELLANYCKILGYK